MYRSIRSATNVPVDFFGAIVALVPGVATLGLFFSFSGICTLSAAFLPR